MWEDRITTWVDRDPIFGEANQTLALILGEPCHPIEDYRGCSIISGTAAHLYLTAVAGVNAIGY